jgi:hypothetical protein
MHTCDNCRVDVGDPDNLIRVWFQDAEYRETAILVCSDCYEQDGEEGAYYTDAEGDHSWQYGESRPC